VGDCWREDRAESAFWGSAALWASRSNVTRSIRAPSSAVKSEPGASCDERRRGRFECVSEACTHPARRYTEETAGGRGRQKPVSRMEDRPTETTGDADTHPSEETLHPRESVLDRLDVSKERTQQAVSRQNQMNRRSGSQPDGPFGLMRKTRKQRRNRMVSVRGQSASFSVQRAAVGTPV
jgi:hypothetical protein